MPTPVTLTCLVRNSTYPVGEAAYVSSEEPQRQCSMLELQRVLTKHDFPAIAFDSKFGSSVLGSAKQYSDGYTQKRIIIAAINGKTPTLENMGALATSLQLPLINRDEVRLLMYNIANKKGSQVHNINQLAANLCVPLLLMDTKASLLTVNNISVNMFHSREQAEQFIYHLSLMLIGYLNENGIPDASSTLNRVVRPILSELGIKSFPQLRVNTSEPAPFRR